MMNALVLGQSWVAEELGAILECPVASLLRAPEHQLYSDDETTPVIIHADSVSPEEVPLNSWRWVFRTLATRVLFAEAYWLQVSTVDVLAGAFYTRPYTVSDNVRPWGFGGKVMATLEWALPSLGYPTAIVRHSSLYNGQAKAGLYNWLLDTIKRGHATVAPEIVSPTSIGDFAKALEWVISTRREGTFHAANRGKATYKDMTELLADKMQWPRPAIEFAPSDLGPPSLALISTVRLRPWQYAMVEPLKRLDGRHEECYNVGQQ